jgi:hypothetical protein
MLTPEKWNSVKFFATVKNILGCYMPLAPGNHPPDRVIHSHEAAKFLGNSSRKAID